MNIRRYNDAVATAAHEGTIRAHEVLPFGDILQTPFHSAWGYLDGAGALEVHAHAHDEIYIIFEGEGIVMLGDEKEKVGNADVIEIPSCVPHNIQNIGPGKLLWLAFWWDHKA